MNHYKLSMVNKAHYELYVTAASEDEATEIAFSIDLDDWENPRMDTISLDISQVPKAVDNVKIVKEINPS